MVSRSRLCAEATHESPIQAVRKPTQRDALGLDTEEGSTRDKMGPSLLRKLWCLKATNSNLKKPPLRSEASPLQRPRCGPITALSRTADPHGESPLRWKPRAETQSPEEVGSLAEPERAETVHQLDTSWLVKPWRTFRTMMATRAKKGSVLSGNERNPGAIGRKVLSLPAELETSPATSATKPNREQQNNAVAVEDKTPPSTPPSVADELCGSQEDEGANRTPQHRLESHRRMEAILKPVPKLPVREENGCCEDNPILEVVSELEGIQTEVCYLPGGRKLEAGGAGTEDEGPEQGDNGYWPELSAREDLAELAENPGGQGMEVNLPSLLEPCPYGKLERGAEGSPTSVPAQTAVPDPLGENSSSSGSPTGQQLPSPTEPPGATLWPTTPGPEEKQKRLIYVAAVEIVEAAIDAAAEQLAKKKEQEKAGHREQADAKADSLAGAAMQQ
ncbi:UNVERIFIED_CONTAM: hypothetical protein K2H54_036270 [Gekko kuhli]